MNDEAAFMCLLGGSVNAQPDEFWGLSLIAEVRFGREDKLQNTVELSMYTRPLQIPYRFRSHFQQARSKKIYIIDGNSRKLISPTLKFPSTRWNWNYMMALI
jgi:hypothetical protein